MAKMTLKYRMKENFTMEAATSPDAFWSSLLLQCVDSGPPGRLKEGPMWTQGGDGVKVILSFMRKLSILPSVIPEKKVQKKLGTFCWLITPQNKMC